MTTNVLNNPSSEEASRALERAQKAIADFKRLVEQDRKGHRVSSEKFWMVLEPTKLEREKKAG